MSEPALPEIPQDTIDRQRAASNPVASAWVSANAGTGKTHVLTQRVTRLLLEGTPPHRLLCLTFTKAAAAEMANRLFKRLGHWAVCPDTELVKELEDFTGEPVAPNRLPRARRLFAQALETPGGLKIQTVHAFCERLLKLFPVEAGVQPGFKVLDERAAGDLLAEARDESLATDEESLRRAVAFLAPQINEQSLDSLVSAIVSLPVGKALAEGRADAFDRRHLARHLGIADTITPTEVIDRFLVDMKARKQELKRWASVLAAEGLKSGKAAADEIEVCLRAQASPELFERYCGIYLTKTEGTPRKNFPVKAVVENHPDVADAVWREQERVLQARRELKAALILERTTALLTLASAIILRYRTKKRERGALDYADQIQCTRHLLAGSAAASWVLYKLDGGLDHILVDEAQDTSPDQWSVIQSLAGEFFAGAGARAEVGLPGPRTVFAVGDEKQSIYSFQGADPAKFHEQREEFFKRATNARAEFEVVELDLSFRSTPEVLKIVDATFEDPDAARRLTPEGDPVRHAPLRAGDAGLVELWPLVEPEEATETTPWDAPMDQESASAPHARLAKQIADTIKTWLANKEELESKGRAIRPQDIMVLVQRRNVFVEEIIRELKQRNIPVAGADRLKLAEHIAVMDLMALGRFALLPEDDLTLATVLKSPFLNISESELFDLAYGRAGSLWAALTEKGAADPAWAQVRDYLARLRGAVDTLPPFEFYTAVLDRPVVHLGGAQKTGWQALYHRLGQDSQDPVKEFLNLALSYEKDHAPGLQSFLHFLETENIEIKREMDQGRNEVRVMTVHGSKGLESPIVFLPDTCRVPDARHDGGILEEEDGTPFWAGSKNSDVDVTEKLRSISATERIAEYHRLLYVAMTRARDRLYVAGYKSNKPLNDQSWYCLIERAMRDRAQEVSLPDGRTVLRLSHTSAAQTKKTPREEDREAAPALPLPDFFSKKVSTPVAVGTLVSPSRLPEECAESDDPGDALKTHAFSPLEGGTRRKFLFGRIVHKLLQYLPDHGPAARAAMGKRYLETAFGGDLTPEECDGVLAETLKIMEDPSFAPIFGPGSRAEPSVAGRLDRPGGQAPLHLSGQLDRILVTPQEILIIDYKTNRPPPKTLDGVSRSYVNQMTLYRALLRQIYADRPVRCALLWTDGPRLMEMPAEMLDSALENILGNKHL